MWNETGRFFSDEDDAVAAMAAITESDFGPREWYTNYGRKNAGPRLARFLGVVAGDDETAGIESAHFLSPRDFKGMPRRR